jgi:hypothetical protein
MQMAAEHAAEAPDIPSHIATNILHIENHAITTELKKDLNMAPFVYRN